MRQAIFLAGFIVTSRSRAAAESARADAAIVGDETKAYLGKNK